MVKKESKLRMSKNKCQFCHQNDCLKTLIKDDKLVISCLKCGYEKKLDCL